MNVELVGEINEHTHPPSQDQTKVPKIKPSIKRRSQATHNTPQQILGAALQNISETAAVNLPQIKNLKLAIHSQRKDNDLPPTPLRGENNLVLPERYEVSKAGEQFLIFDSGVGGNERILIFVTPQGIHFLSNKNHWFMDEKFKLCPEIFYQVYIIHALNNNQVLTCVFTLLPNKNTKMKIHTTDFSEKSGMLSSGRRMNLLIFSLILKELQQTDVTNQMPQLQVLKVNFNLI